MRIHFEFITVSTWLWVGFLLCLVLGHSSDKRLGSGRDAPPSEPQIGGQPAWQSVKTPDRCHQADDIPGHQASDRAVEAFWPVGAVWRSGRSSSEHGAELPGGELFVPEAELLALGPLARRHGQHEVEDLPAHILDAERAVDDGPAVDVHVL